MIRCGTWPVGVCTWSLRMEPQRAADALHSLSVEHIHLALRPALESGSERYLRPFLDARHTITATMIDFPQEDYSSLESIRATGGIAPDQHWQDNRRLFLQAVELTSRLAAPYISMHAGFIDLENSDAVQKFCDRIGQLADAAAQRDIVLLLETGQENAEQLKQFLVRLDHPAVAVNFDPANVILYDKGDPAEAARLLAPWIKHVHIKDAIRTDTPGTWGTEVPWDKGQVGGEAFLLVLKEIGFDGAIAVEREAGDKRFADIKSAVESLARFSLAAG